MRTIITIILSILLISCGGSDANCPQGAETCECYGNNTCDTGLICLSSLCVNQNDGDTDGDIDGDTNDGDTTDGDIENDNDNSENTTDGDNDTDGDTDGDTEDDRPESVDHEKLCKDEECPGAGMCNNQDMCETFCLTEGEKHPDYYKSCSGNTLLFSTIKYGGCEFVPCKENYDCEDLIFCTDRVRVGNKGIWCDISHEDPINWICRCD